MVPCGPHPLPSVARQPGLRRRGYRHPPPPRKPRPQERVKRELPEGSDRVLCYCRATVTCYTGKSWLRGSWWPWCRGRASAPEVAPVRRGSSTQRCPDHCPALSLAALTLPSTVATTFTPPVTLLPLLFGTHGHLLSSAEGVPVLGTPSVALFVTTAVV